MKALRNTQLSVATDPNMSNLQSPILRDLYDFWLGLGAGDGLPTRSDFVPTDLPARLLPHIAIVDVIRDGEGLNFCWRLIGTHSTSHTGRDMTGRHFDEIYAGEDFDNMFAPYVWLVQNAMPLRWYGNAQFVEKEWMMVEIAGMPLASDGRTVDKIFLGAFYAPHPA